MITKRILYTLKAAWLSMLSRRRHVDPADIPVVINSFNRLTTLRLLTDSLEQRGITNIVIIDNQSTYGPLLEWLERCPYRVIHLGDNLGFRAIWRSPLTRKLRKGWFIYTDSDVMLSPDCPSDVVARLYKAMTVDHPMALKAGLSIRIDDLPAHYAHREQVIASEKRFWQQRDGSMYRAPIDTTFALYRPGSGLNRSRAAESWRLAPPYSLLHLPWYADSSSPSDEEQYYLSHCRHATTWSSISHPE